MANIFDKDTTSTDNHLLNEQFHAFSKSPSSPSSTLGGASNRSGHTVTANDVWAEKIPAFFYPKADSDYATCKANAKLNDLCRWGNEIQIWNGSEFVKFADNYNAIPDGWIFCNENNEPVVRFHKSRIAYNLNDINNAYDNSLDAANKGASAKIQGWNGPVKKYTATLGGDTITYESVEGSMHPYVESAPNFITQFVAPTDNIVKGVPSKGYGPIVIVGGIPLTEDADSTAGYIANNFAGIIQFNERKAQGTVTVHAFEYCGKTLGTTIGDIADLESKLTPITTAITDIQATANSKVADIKINETSIVNETSKVASLTTTNTDIIAANANSKSTNLATEASVAKAVASLEGIAAKALEDAKAYSDGLHSTNLVYIVLGDDETLPEPSAKTVGKIYLVKEGNTANGESNVNALSGSYVEYMTRKISETEYTWEKIGTTAADLSAYAKTADVTEAIATATQTTTLVSEDGALTAPATDDEKKFVTASGIYTAINTAIDALDAEESVNGIIVTQENGKITEIKEELITASVPAGTTSVEGNVAYVGATKHVIAPEKFQTAAQMPATLTSWVADLSNLTDGTAMFMNCSQLTTFIGDLSSLEIADEMFKGCNLDAESLEIIADILPTVTSGTIDIGASTNATDEVIATIKGKGWKVRSNNTLL